MDRNASRERRVSHGPAHGAMKEGVGFVGRTDLDTGSASRAPLIPYSHGRTFLDVRRPALISVVHHFITEAEGARGAFTGAFLALGAKVLKPEVDGFIGKQGQIRRDDRCLEPWPEKRVENTVADAAHLAQACPEQDWGNDDLVVSGMVRPSRIA